MYKLVFLESYKDSKNALFLDFNRDDVVNFSTNIIFLRHMIVPDNHYKLDYPTSVY